LQLGSRHESEFCVRQGRTERVRKPVARRSCPATRQNRALSDTLTLTGIPAFEGELREAPRLQPIVVRSPMLRLTIVGDIVRQMELSKTASRVGVSVGLAVLIVVVGSFGFGPRGLTIGVVATFLMLAWRHDNSAGLLFPIAMLVVITIAVLLLLMYLMARMHP